MKSITILLLLTTAVSFSQINVVETKESEEPVLIGKIGGIDEIWIECTKVNNTYTFMYKDMNFEEKDEYKSFSFDDVDGAFDGLYKLMVDGIDNQPEKDMMIELPESFIWLHFDRKMGQSFVEFKHALDKNATVLGVSTWMNKKKLKTVFGK